MTFAYVGLRAPGRYRDAFTNAEVELAASGSIALPAHGFVVLSR